MNIRARVWVGLSIATLLGWSIIIGAILIL
jgi:hypothetical protein